MTSAQDAPGSRNARRKALVREYLTNRDLDSLENWARDERHPMRTLSSLLFDPERLVRWRAIEGLGRVAAIEAGTEPDRVRRQVSRLLWLMNDESGGLCWNAPEAIGEIIRNVPGLIDEYGQLLPSFFIEEPFEAGSRWAVSRVGHLKPEMFERALDDLTWSLKDKDPTIRGFSLMAMAAVSPKRARELSPTIDGDSGQVEFYNYDTGRFETATVAEVASKLSL